MAVALAYIDPRKFGVRRKSKGLGAKVYSLSRKRLVWADFLTSKKKYSCLNYKTRMLHRGKNQKQYCKSKVGGEGFGAIAPPLPHFSHLKIFVGIIC